MEISLRSQIVAGTAAVVGASAIAMTPVLPAHLPSIQLPAAATTSVALAGFDSPLTELINTFNLVPPLIFSNVSLPGFPSPNPVSKLGLIPQIINDALPVVRQLGVNGSAYLLSTLNALTITGQTLSEAVWNFPEAVIDSITSLSLTPIINAILGPVNTIGNTLLDAGNYVLQGVIARATAVVTGTVGSISTLAQAVIGQVTTLVNTALYVGQSVIGASSIEGAWNAAVNGLFGPGSALKPSIPGALVNLTLGLGQALDPTAVVSGSNPLVPSARQLVSGVVQSLKAELATPVPVMPVPTPPPAAAVKVASPRAAAAETSADAVEVATTEDTSGSGAQAGSSDNSDSTPKASKHRVTRKAASE